MKAGVAIVLAVVGIWIAYKWYQNQQSLPAAT